MSRLGSLAAVLAAALAAGLCAPTYAAATPTPAPGHHLMMDAASAPTLASMAKWQASSPYSAIGVYVPVAAGTDNRWDKEQTYLTADWVTAVRAGGWQVLPIYVGLQAPSNCGHINLKMSKKATVARSQGSHAAAYAAAAVYDLGIPVSAPVVYDLEAYDSGIASCTKAVQAFLAGWTTTLHRLGRLSGVYGSRSSTMTDLTAAAADPSYPSPDVIWEATDSGQANTDFQIPATGWEGRRANQFALGVTRTYAGVTIEVDESAVQDTFWQLSPPDGTAPRLTAPAPALATKKRSARIRWRHADASGIDHYEVRVRHARPGKGFGHWTRPKELRHTKKTKMSFELDPGERWCVSVRATDKVGNTSAWVDRCVARFTDQTKLRADKSWRKVRGSYLGSAVKATKPGATLRGGKVAGSRVGVLVHGHGTLAVIVGGHQVGTISAGGGVRVLSLPSTVRGRLTLRTLTQGSYKVDGFAVV
ncbi:glycoside hydrolase domain-containing protein [Nocardioides sp.]|uniref:glycoside hydrolase domain-containing protein n=1 Tax=Nocardioides sp. TaxID=35761 RepID=UPI0039E5F58E